jgi:hypothetical protein
MDVLNDRRQSQRREETFPARLVASESKEIAGETINMSHGGVLLRANGRLPVVVSVLGKRYRGRLVRAVPQDSEITEYAIELQELIGLDPNSAT